MRSDSVCCRAIVGYPDYSITSDGFVISHKFSKDRKLSFGKTVGGYFYVNLLKHGKQTSHYVSRLVADTFIGSVDGLTVNHKDGNKSNNHVDNLEIVTLIENIDHAFENEMHPTPKRPVRQIDARGRVVGVYPSQKVAEQKTGIRQGLISRVVRGINKQTGGFLWEYV